MPISEFKNNHPELCATLLRIRNSGRRGHAYLFVSDDWETAAMLAKAWLQSFACRQTLPDGDACGVCKSCVQFKAGSYPHLHVLQPISKSRQIRVDDILDFEHQIHLTAGQDSFKAGLILEADLLNEQAQNALLKTLEEPPRHTLIILVTSHPRGLLPTIRSRCQTVSMLQNRRSYEFAREVGLFSVLAEMRPGAGAVTALRAARQLLDIFGSLNKLADDNVNSEEDTEGEQNAAAIEQDSQLQKRLLELRAARVQAEYRGLRRQLTEAIHSWYLQQSLLACNVPKEQLPHPEFLAVVEEPGSDDRGSKDLEACENAAAAAARLHRLLEGNMNEKLALQTLCLELCEKS